MWADQADMDGPQLSEQSAVMAIESFFSRYWLGKLQTRKGTEQSTGKA